MRTTSVMLLVSSAALALSACSKKAPEDIPPPPADTAPTTPTPPPPPSGPVAGSQADFIASVTSDTILFDTDKSDIDDEDRAVLRSQAEWLMRYPNKRITVEGHCDERGTREYNLALGERRANAAKNYLAALGIDAGRITTISYGKERPVALGSDEASWAQNRRAVTVTVD
ncbi:peptidoglycan-associated lipoprotein [Sphingobium sp. SYK-6]|uniref:peptidoglycan-associated lipoprotein Pal n=1 Tax=Sphingobium sp. (strain NBRC 103272 / SYK-6) TaxID=627192 RepID=UPI0002276CC1|nr:peptidoglycan-associated lipoprotein Pal [Sphingobium sp. SYK-6]BAK64921.1 peptidoglycan-associated lipoprotein [Sphingobium sp. SYK-6]